MSKERPASGPVANELTLVRTFDAPRDLVFRAWTDPAHLLKWWGPAGFTTNMRKWEPHPGGAILLDMIAPYGEVYPMGGSFVEVAPPRRLVFKSSALDKAGKSIFEILNTVTLVEDGTRTKVTLHTRVISKQGDADQYLKGQREGWTQSLDRLETLVTAVGR